MQLARTAANDRTKMFVDGVPPLCFVFARSLATRNSRWFKPLAVSISSKHAKKLHSLQYVLGRYVVYDNYEMIYCVTFWDRLWGDIKFKFMQWLRISSVCAAAAVAAPATGVAAAAAAVWMK